MAILREVEMIDRMDFSRSKLGHAMFLFIMFVTLDNNSFFLILNTLEGFKFSALGLSSSNMIQLTITH